MFCRYCGSPVPDGMKICPKCGKPIIAAADEAAEEKSGEGMNNAKTDSTYADWADTQYGNGQNNWQNYQQNGPQNNWQNYQQNGPQNNWQNYQQNGPQNNGWQGQNANGWQNTGQPADYQSYEKYVNEQTLNGMAVASLVLGIAGFFIAVFGVVPVLAIVFGAISRRQIEEKPNEFRGEGMATAGFVLGIISLVFYIVMILVLGSIVV